MTATTSTSSSRRRMTPAIILTRLLHTQVITVPRNGQVLTGHPFRPTKAVLLHDRSTSSPCPFTNAPANRQRLMIVLYTNRGIHRTQEELQIRRALDLDQRPKLVHLQPCFLLRLVVHFIWERRQVIPNPPTHRYRNLLAPRVRILRYRRQVRRRTYARSSIITAIRPRTTQQNQHHGQLTNRSNRHLSRVAGANALSNLIFPCSEKVAEILSLSGGSENFQLDYPHRCFLAGIPRV